MAVLSYPGSETSIPYGFDRLGALPCGKYHRFGDMEPGYTVVSFFLSLNIRKWEVKKCR
jgi:hypothetical protein